MVTERWGQKLGTPCKAWVNQDPWSRLAFRLPKSSAAWLRSLQMTPSDTVVAPSVQHWMLMHDFCAAALSGKKNALGNPVLPK